MGQSIIVYIPTFAKQEYENYFANPGWVGLKS